MDWAPHSRAVIERLGVPALWTPAGASDDVELTGLYFEPYALIEGEVNGSDPLFVCMAADADGIARGDELHVAGANWTVANAEPDRPSGRVRIRLQAVE